MWWLVSALLLAPQSAPPNPYRDAGAALASGDLARAQASLEDLTVKDPGNGRAWMLLAQTYARRKNVAAALAAASKSETLGTQDAEVFQGLVFLFTNLQPDLKRAADLEAHYAELQPSDKDAWRRVAKMYLEAREYDRAIVAGTRGLAAAPYDENAHFLLIQMYLEHQDFDHATEAIANARKVFARSPQIELAAGVCAYGLRHFDEALEQFLKTIDLAPDVPQPYQFLGRMLDHAGERMPEVTKRFREFHARHPDDSDACVLYAKVLMAGLDPGGFPPEAEQAMRLLEHGRSIDGNQAETHYQIGCLLERKRDFAGAASELERSVALDPREPFAHFHLARVYERLGRKQDAARELDKHQKMTESVAQ
jgi:tetratricopeptide (TPR) repeat protein